ncbi:caspase domain-containing protein [Trichoderma chlorosporum]
MPKRYALLVGINLYLNDGSRKVDNGQELSLGNLHGCLNDVNAVRQLLVEEYEFDEISMLTSSCPGDNDEQDTIYPLEPVDRWPTFSNIQNGFHSVCERAVAGDFFYFHYSGHGGRLKRVQGSPVKQLTDPSLLTVDFCCGQPAVRGWQLNQWLKKLHNKGIQIVVTLDSCYSGSSWRIAEKVSYRTPADWPLAPSLLADEEAAAATLAQDNQEHAVPAHRDAELEISWSINRQAFTLIAACGSDEKAAERVFNGKTGGAFTQELLDYLKPSEGGSRINVTYRMISDQLTTRLMGQTPGVYGRDKLLFLGSSEPFSIAPVVVRVEGDRIIIPAGSAHGVHIGSEFALYPEIFGIIFSVDEIDDFECSAMAPDELEVQLLKRHGFAIAPSRWSFGEETILQVFVDAAFGLEFQGWLREQLRTRIASPVRVIEYSNAESHTDPEILRLEKWGEDDVKIWGPEWLTGYDNCIRPLRLRDEDPKELVAKIAPVIAHLTRFRQLLGLKPVGFNALPFVASVNPVMNSKATGGLYPLTQKFRFVFENRDCEEELHFTVIVLSPAFGIEQLYPPRDRPQTVAPGKRQSFNFFLKIPNGPDWAQESLRQSVRRDIIRTIVTRGRIVSWKSLELPNIWDASPTGPRRKPLPGRDARLAIDSDWWIHDEHLLTDVVEQTTSGG